jgi:putative NIF3 family GTP cyclohydrolase 1 type 2
MAGTGTFFGEEGADPAVGKAGRLESVAEVRLETVVPLARIDEVVKALRAAHSYEEPPFDLLRLMPPPESRGFGCVGAVDAATVADIVARLKAALGVEHVLVAGDTGRSVERVAVCAGSGGELVDDAIASGAQLFVTGELRHHDALRVVEAGLVAVCTRHSTSERAALVPLRARLSALLPGVAVTCSTVDREPLTFT